MKKIPSIFLIMTISLSLTSCNRYSSEKDLDTICLHMDKEEVLRKMSSKGVARGAIVNKHNQLIEVREYQVDKGKSGDDIAALSLLTICTLGITAPLFFTPINGIDTYWLYFCDGKLVQWGKAGDWKEAEKQIYDINFNVTTKS